MDVLKGRAHSLRMAGVKGLHEPVLRVAYLGRLLGPALADERWHAACKRFTRGRQGSAHTK